MKHVLMLLLMSPAALGATISNKLIYEPNSPSWVSWHGQNITTRVAITNTDVRPYYVEANPWGVYNAGLEIMFTNTNVPPELLQLS